MDSVRTKFLKNCLYKTRRKNKIHWMRSCVKKCKLPRVDWSYIKLTDPRRFYGQKGPRNSRRRGRLRELVKVISFSHSPLPYFNMYARHNVVSWIIAWYSEGVKPTWALLKYLATAKKEIPLNSCFQIVVIKKSVKMDTSRGWKPTLPNQNEASLITW